MRHNRRAVSLFAILLTFALHLYAAAAQPKLQATVRERATIASSEVSVEASDDVGLDSLELSCDVCDTTYHTGLSAPELVRSLKRSFTINKLFPASDIRAKQITLKVTIRNTRGVSTSSTLSIHAKSN